MMQSRLNPMLTLEYMRTAHENKYFDRKSAKIKPADLAPLISAFANADGGTIVIGISDKEHILEGIKSVGEDRVNEFIPADFNWLADHHGNDVRNEKTFDFHNLIILLFN